MYRQSKAKTKGQLFRGLLDETAYTQCRQFIVGSLCYYFALDLLPMQFVGGKKALCSLFLLCLLCRIYRLQQEGQAFKDVASLLAALSKEILRMTKMSTTDWLTEQGLSPLIIDELVMSVVQCNYGQTPAVHALVGGFC